MRVLNAAGFAATVTILVGCATPSGTTITTPISVVSASRFVPDHTGGPVVAAGYVSDEPGEIAPHSSPDTPAEVGLPQLIGMTVERNPRLTEVGWAVEAARGQAIQAGLYPNPVLSITGDELGDRTGPGGIWTTPMVSQEIVTADKLGLSKAAAMKKVDEATLTVISERYRLFTDVRRNFFEVVVLQRRAEVLGELVELADKSVDSANKLLEAKEVAVLDVVQLEVDLERYRADLEATKRTIPAAYRKLAASVGAYDLPYAAVDGDLNAPLPDYELDRVRAYVLSVHPAGDRLLIQVHFGTEN